MASSAWGRGHPLQPGEEATRPSSAWGGGWPYQCGDEGGLISVGMRPQEPGQGTYGFTWSVSFKCSISFTTFIAHELNRTGSMVLTLRYDLTLGWARQ